MSKKRQQSAIHYSEYAVGGQAVLEGVMMRSPNYTVVTVRKTNGEMAVMEDFYQNLSRRFRILGLPFLRGVINLLEMIYIGGKGLMFSSQQALAEESSDQSGEKEKAGIGNVALILTLITSLALTILIFKFLPYLLTNWVGSGIGLVQEQYWLFNLVDGVLKIVIFVLYLYLIGLTPDMKRVFMYHGAEHKTIMTFEKGQDLTVENAQKNVRFHPRCGTSFILLVFLISIAVYTVLPRGGSFIEGFAMRILCLPIIAGISYEFLKFSAKYHQSMVFKLITAPGLLLQRLTTREPEPAMLEIAIHSLQRSLLLEKKHQENVL